MVFWSVLKPSGQKKKTWSQQVTGIPLFFAQIGLNFLWGQAKRKPNLTSSIGLWTTIVGQLPSPFSRAINDGIGQEAGAGEETDLEWRIPCYDLQSNTVTLTNFQHSNTAVSKKT